MDCIPILAEVQAYIKGKMDPFSTPFEKRTGWVILRSSGLFAMIKRPGLNYLFAQDFATIIPTGRELFLSS